jgi:co-chaperonin GroES (HSP10)
MNSIPIEMKNGYILIQDIKNETITEAGLYIPDEQYKRFARVLKVYEGSTLKEGDIIVKPIGRTTPITIDGVKYDCLKEGFVFAKVVDDET